MRFFNTAGPVKCEKHYCLPPLTRFDLNEVLSLRCSPATTLIMKNSRNSGIR